MTTISLVVKNNACVGCGFCAAHAPDTFRMAETEFGTYEAQVRDRQQYEADDAVGRRVCPFADGNPDEDALASAAYGHLAGIEHTSPTGYYLRLMTGAVTDSDTRIGSSSGGLISWTARALLARGDVDVVACVGPVDTPGSMFGYRLVRDPDELLGCRKSRYYPIEVSEVIAELRTTDERVAFIGLPCFVKSLRLFLAAEPELAPRFKYTIGLFCGHLKSKQYADYLSRSCGVPDDQMRSIDFRKKLEGRSASDYAVEVQAVVNDEAVKRSLPMRDVFGGRWGTNLFMVGACNWCDDVMAETADMAVGDTWIKPYSDDYRGSSTVIVRHPDLVALLEEGVARGELDLQPISADDVIASQAGGLRQRRDGLAYRLARARARGAWCPTKRVTADSRKVGRLFALALRLRERSRRTSHRAMLAQRGHPGLRIFRRRMWPWVQGLELLYRVRAAMRRRR